MITITLPPELEQTLTEKAREQGTTPELLAIDSLQKIYAPPSVSIEAEGETLADYWADYIGTIDSREVVPGGAHLSENTGRKFAELLREKHLRNKR
jgi:hypothetical protein